MWPFHKKTTIAHSRLLAGGSDHHSHILPGVDDGIESLQEALNVLALYQETGIKELWLTPHIMEDFPNTPALLQERFAALQAAYKGDIALHLAAEYMLDGHFATVMERGEFLPTGHAGNHLLVETSYFTPPMNLHATLRNIQSRGYHPLLAHPERYIYMGKKEYTELKEMGIKFQLNILSLAGAYGREAQKKALWLLGNGMYSAAGSDLHSAGAIELISQTKLNAAMTEKLKNTITTKL